MKPHLTIVTGNSLKFKEISLELSPHFECIQGTLPDYQEIQGTPEEIVSHKLKAAYEKFQQPVVVDDTSFHLESLKGFPGPYIKDFTIALTIEGIGVQFKGEQAVIKSWIGFMAQENDIIVVEGSVGGLITEAVGFDPKDWLNFDSIFIPDGQTKSFHFMTREEKNTCSHRGNAVRTLINKLQKR